MPSHLKRSPRLDPRKGNFIQLLKSKGNQAFVTSFSITLMMKWQLLKHDPQIPPKGSPSPKPHSTRIVQKTLENPRCHPSKQKKMFPRPPRVLFGEVFKLHRHIVKLYPNSYGGKGIQILVPWLRQFVKMCKNLSIGAYINAVTRYPKHVYHRKSI